jgi:hypothetical protein
VTDGSVSESESDAAPAYPAPPARGWYRVPDNPNYEHFWDGQKWTSQRYWGGGSPRTNGPAYGPPPAAESRVPDAPPPPVVDPPWAGGPSARAPISPGVPGAPAPQMRFYSVTTMIVPPVFIGVFVLVAVAALPNHASRPVGIGAAVLAVLFLGFARRPYVGIVGPDGSLTFKALVGSKQTTISRVTRVGLRSGGARGGSSWIFHFDATKAVLGDIGGSRLARYVIACNPAVEYPGHRFFQ